MGIEIERKFLVIGNDWKTLGTGQHYCQGYLVSDKQRTVRIRIAGDRGYLTIKSRSVGIRRNEFEYEIPHADADLMLRSLCTPPLIEKIRYTIDWNGMTWEVDEFLGDNAGLVLAEVELQDEHQAIDIPPWIGQEVSADPRYFNSSLAKNPYSRWATDT